MFGSMKFERRLVMDTWKDVLKALQSLTPEQLEMLAQVVLHESNDENVVAGRPVVCLGSVNELGVKYFRSAQDNRRHGDQVVLTVDNNGFSEAGVVAWSFEDAQDWVDGNPGKPLYPHGYTPDQDWTGPAQKIADAILREGPDGSWIEVGE
jgi:hypothetical protein